MCNITKAINSIKHIPLIENKNHSPYIRCVFFALKEQSSWNISIQNYFQLVFIFLVKPVFIFLFW